jgi:alanyl-tRNA synthetase
VISCEADGERYRVVLDQTAFYPTSGGQPFDTGRLGAARVVEVADGPDESVVHVTTAPLRPGERVQGEIDWARRFDHMQQHTGQHVLSAVFAARAGAVTTSFHLGAETATIDLDRDLTTDAIARVEAGANQVVWDNRIVRVRFVSHEEALSLPLRKPHARIGEVRLVDIDACDLSACGGTHVPATGMIGMIAVTASERFKGGTRVTFVCGGRALRSHAMFRDIVLQSTRVLSVAPGEVVAGLERLQAEGRALNRTVRGLHDELAQSRAADLRATAETLGRYRVVIRADAEGDAAGLKALAVAVTSAPGLVAVFAGAGQPVPLVVARSADVDLDAAALVREAVAVLGGRGGGRPEAAQAGVSAPSDRVLAFAHDALLRR